MYLFSGSDGKVSACNVGDLGSIPGSGRSPGEGNGNPLQYSYLENSMDGGTWWATVHGVTKNQTWLNDFTLTFWLLTKFTILTISFAQSSDTKYIQIFLRLSPPFIFRTFLLPQYETSHHINKNSLSFSPHSFANHDSVSVH